MAGLADVFRGFRTLFEVVYFKGCRPTCFHLKYGGPGVGVHRFMTSTSTVESHIGRSGWNFGPNPSFL